MTAKLTYKGEEITLDTMEYFWGQISKGNYIYWDHKSDDFSKFVGSFLWGLKKRNLFLNSPSTKGPLTKEDARILVNLKIYREYQTKQSDALKVKSLALEEYFRDTLLIPFLASIMKKPKYLLAGGLNKKGETKAKSAVSGTERNLENCFDKVEEVAWFLWAVMTGDDGVSVNVLNKEKMEITLKEFIYNPVGSTDSTVSAGKVGSFAVWLANLSDRDALKIYEKVVYGNEDLPIHDHGSFKVDKSKTVPEEMLAMCMVTDSALELKLEESYTAWVLPTVSIESLERKLEGMTKSIKELRKLYDTYRNRYPSTMEDTKLTIVKTICESPFAYLTTTHKEIKVLAEILVNGYESDKVIQRVQKALNK